MKISDEGRIECAKCGMEWSPMVRAGGRMPKGYFICPRCGWNQRDGSPDGDGEAVERVGVTVEDAGAGR